MANQWELQLRNLIKKGAGDSDWEQLSKAISKNDRVELNKFGFATNLTSGQSLRLVPKTTSPAQTINPSAFVIPENLVNLSSV